MHTIHLLSLGGNEHRLLKYAGIEAPEPAAFPQGEESTDSEEDVQFTRGSKAHLLEEAAQQSGDADDFLQGKSREMNRVLQLADAPADALDPTNGKSSAIDEMKNVLRVVRDAIKIPDERRDELLKDLENEIFKNPEADMPLDEDQEPADAAAPTNLAIPEVPMTERQRMIAIEKLSAIEENEPADALYPDQI